MTGGTGERMRRRISLLALCLLSTGCPDLAGDCNNTLSCEPPIADVIVVVSDAGVACSGVCVPAVVDSLGWSSVPFIFWQGYPADLLTTQCPAYAGTQSQLYYGAPDGAPLSCSACACSSSTATCTLPATVTVSASPVCPGEAGDAGAPVDPPSAWDGGCTTNDEIAAAPCDGGPCLATVGPMAPLDGGCAPVQPVVPRVITWTAVAFACAGDTNHGACVDPSTICVPPPPPKFSVCVSRDGDDAIVECPAGYPQRSVFYLGGDDNRGCSPCECGPPQGDACSSLVSIYADDACSVQTGAVTAGSSGPVCVSVPADSPPGSRQASAPVYTPGTCQPSGGEPTGSIEPQYPVTVCCQL